MPKRQKERPYEYRWGPDGEPILPGFFDDYGGSGIIVLDKPAQEEESKNGETNPAGGPETP